MQNVVMVPLFAYFLYVRCHKFGSRGKNLEKHKANSLTIFADVFESRNVNLSPMQAHPQMECKWVNQSEAGFQEIAPALG